jgi:uncharacterized protein involved in outer membrane biogenesis
MRLARALRFSLIGLLALLATSVVLLLTINLGRFKAPTEDLVSNLLGREFTIAGGFEFSLGRRIHLVAEGVSLSATDWSANASLATIERLEATVDLWSLFRAPLLIESLDIQQVRVYLESEESGLDNWTLFPPGETEEGKHADAGHQPMLPVMVVDAAITDFKLTYRTPKRLHPLSFTVAKLRTRQTMANDLQLALSGAMNDTPLELTARAGPVDHLVNFHDINFDLSGKLGEIGFDAAAILDDRARRGRSTARLHLQGPNAEYLTGVLGLQQVTTGPLDLIATIEPAGEKTRVLLDGNFGEFALDVNAELVSLRNLQELDLHVAASGPDASTVAKLFGIATVPEDPFNIVGNLRRSGSMIDVEEFRVTAGESQFEMTGHFDNYPDPHGASVMIGLAGPEISRFSKLLGLPGVVTGPFSMDAELMPSPDGGASVDVKATARDIKATIVANVTSDPSFLGTRLEATIAGPDLHTLATAIGLAESPGKPFELKLALKRIPEGAAIETGTFFIADDRLSLQGLVGDKPLEADTDIQFQLSGPDFAGTLLNFGLNAESLPYARYEASGRVMAGAKLLTLQDVKVAVGDALEYTLTTDGQLSTGPGFIGTNFRLDASGASLGAVARAVAITGMPDLPFEAGGKVERVANGLFVRDGSLRVGNDNLTLQGLIGNKPLERDTNVRIDAHALDLKETLKTFGINYAGLPPGQFDVSGELLNRNGSFVLKRLGASLAGARLNANGTLGPLPDFQGTRLTLRVHGADLSRLLPDDPDYSALNKPYELSATVEMSDQQLRVENINAVLDETRLSGSLGLRLSPLLGSGRFAIDGSSPDAFRLLPAERKLNANEKAPLELHAQGNWTDSVWTLDKFFLQVGKGNVTANGTFDGPPNFDRTDLSFDWNVASISNLSVLAGRNLPPDPARLSFRLHGAGDVVKIEKFEAAIGDSDLTGDFSYHHSEVPRIQLGIWSDRLNIAPYLPRPGDPELRPGKPGVKEGKKDRIIPDLTIPVDLLHKYDGSVNLQIAELNLPQRTLNEVALSATAEDAVLLVKEFNFRSSDNESLNGTIEIHAKETGAEMLLAAQGAGFTAALPGLSKDERAALPKIGLDVVLHGTGATVRELAGTLDGYTHVSVGPGKVRPTALKFLADDFLSQVLGVINPFSKTDPYTKVICAEALLRLKEGVISGRPALVMQTERVNVFAVAAIDLKTEKLAVNVNTVPQKGLGLSLSDLINPYTNISGTLAKPTLTLDPQAAVIEGGVAVATGGLSILAKRFAERYLTAADACGKAASDALPEFRAVKAFYYPENTTAQ